MKALFRWVVALFFILGGANHFRTPAIYLAMIPPGLPDKPLLNAISGIAEICGGIGILIPATRRLAGWGLMALLVAVFPANLYVALRGHMDGLNVSSTVLWWRIPFQLVFFASVWWSALS